MDNIFLEKEREFLEENKLLELKTKEIFRKVDDIKKVQYFQPQDFKPEASIELKDIHLPRSVDEMGMKGMIPFYKSKIKSLQGALEKTQSELKGKDDELKKLQKDHQLVTEEKEKWFLQYNVEKNSNTKLEKQISACNAKILLKDTENTRLRKEIEQFKVDLKNSRNELNASATRLKHTLQENAKLMESIKLLRQEEKESKEMYQNNIKDLTTTLKQIQKNKNELLQGYKKQIQLIDNLQKQKVQEKRLIEIHSHKLLSNIKAHIESLKVMELCDNDFLKLLEWKMN